MSPDPYPEHRLCRSCGHYLTVHEIRTTKTCAVCRKIEQERETAKARTEGASPT